MGQLTNDLLKQLLEWCEQERGRKSQVARYLEIDPQALSNLFGGRQQLTGEQALATQKFLLEQRGAKGRATVTGEKKRRPSKQARVATKAKRQKERE